MKTNEQENKTEESFGIPERRSEGVAGPSREVSKRDAAASGADIAGQENTDEQNVQTGDTARQPVTRARGLHRQGTGQKQKSKSAIRKQSLRDLKSPDAEERLIEMENAFREFVSFASEQQDRMYNPELGFN
jgi:hypothetical protein